MISMNKVPVVGFLPECERLYRGDYRYCCICIWGFLGLGMARVGISFGIGDGGAASQLRGVKNGRGRGCWMLVVESIES